MLWKIVSQANSGWRVQKADRISFFTLALLIRDICSPFIQMAYILKEEK